MNRLDRETQILILRLLCEGNSIRSASRITGTHKSTVSKLILTFGNGATKLMHDAMRNLTPRHLEIDEIWTFCHKKQGKLTDEEKATRDDIGDIYLWTALDQDTKLLPAFLVGKRSADNAFAFLSDVAKRIKLPRPGQSDDSDFVGRVPRPVVQISTDGLKAYPEAIDLALGPYASHGILIKDYIDEKSGRYAPPQMKATKRIVHRGSIHARTICTSHVERHNLTIRTFMKRFTRLSLGFSKKLENLQAAVGLFLAYYNFVWRTRYPDDSGKRGTLRPTAALMAGVTNRLWSFEDFYREVIMYA